MNSSSLKEISILTLAVCMCIIADQYLSWIITIIPIPVSPMVIVAGLFFGVLRTKSRLVVHVLVLLFTVYDATYSYLKISSTVPAAFKLFSHRNEATNSTSIAIKASEPMGMLIIAVAFLLMLTFFYAIYKLIRAVMKDRSALFYAGSIIIPQLVLYFFYIIQMSYYNYDISSINKYMESADPVFISIIINMVLAETLSLAIIMPYYIYWMFRATGIYKRIQTITI